MARGRTLADVPIEVRWASASHAGCVRTANQDAVLAGPAAFAVADGMGGHAAGEVASSIAIARLAELPAVATEADVVTALVDANTRIRAEGRPGSGREGMGTTVSGLVLAETDGADAVLVFNVGDSRTYRLSGDDLQQVTTDHSLVAEMARTGELDADAARTHPARNVVTRALGIDPDLHVDRWWLAPVPGERFLVCSDGLTNELDTAQLREVLLAHDDVQDAVDRLLNDALDHGARDNVSIVVVQIDQVVAGSSDIDDDTNPRLVIPSDDDGMIDALPFEVDETAPAAPHPGGPLLITGVPSGEPAEASPRR